MVAVPSCLAILGVVLAQQDPADAPLPHDVLVATVPADLEVEEASIRCAPWERRQQASTLVWSTDGKRVAYVGKRGEDMFPVVGDRVGKAYSIVTPPVIAGEHVFFQVMQPRKRAARARPSSAGFGSMAS